MRIMGYLIYNLRITDRIKKCFKYIRKLDKIQRLGGKEEQLLKKKEQTKRVCASSPISNRFPHGVVYYNNNIEL